jgi:CDP-glucose 4,6-dehydratase
MQAQFWHNKKIFLTGHTGFKGAWLSLWLQAWGAKICGYALPPQSHPNLFDLLHLVDDLENHFADIRDAEKLSRLMQKFQPDIVIHMAAQPLVRYSYQHPVETYAVNVMGTVNVLEAFRNSSARLLLNVTTDKVYENKEQVHGYSEDEPLGGYDPYSSSKACSELVTAAYRASFFNPRSFQQHHKAVASARAGNVIGGGDWSEDRIVPDLIRGFSKKMPVFIRYPQAIRPWQHVLESLSGYMTLLERLWAAPQEFAAAFNFGPSEQDCISVADLTSLMAKTWGEGAIWQADLHVQPHEANFLKLNTDKAKIQLNWQPVWNVQQAITAVVAWYKTWHLGQDMRAYTLSQLQEYIRDRHAF